MTDDVIYGTCGVLAYDELADRIQCHACGRWYHKLTSFHLKRHGLTIPSYKELYGLNDTTPLETPRITALRRQQALDHDAARYLVPGTGTNAAATLHAVWRGRKHRAEYYKRHQTPADRQANSRRRQRWTDDEMLAALRAAQAEAGGVLTRYYLDRRGPDGPSERCPTSWAVIRRFASWQRVCELLGQPYRTTRLPKPPGTHRKWSDEAILAALRELKERCGGRLTCEALRRHASGYKGRVGAVPSHKTVQAHLGPWRRVCDLLDRT